MTKKWFQRAVTAAMVFLLAAGQCVTGFADDWDNGTPGLVIGGDRLSGRNDPPYHTAEKYWRGNGGKRQRTGERRGRHYTL